MVVFLKKRLRLLAFLLLAGVTLYGVVNMLSGDWRTALEYWRSKLPVFCLVFLLQWLDISLDSFLWMIILHEFNIRPGRRMGYIMFFAGYAGLLLPLQLGRFIRADAIARMHIGSAADGVKVELILLYLVATAAGSLFAGVVASRVHLLLAPLAVVAAIAFCLFFADRLFAVLSRTPANLPHHFWRKKSIVLVAFLAMVGWWINGTLLYLVIYDLPGDVAYWHALIIGPGNLIAGLATGLPGGIGAVEGLLGLSLDFVNIPPEHQAMAVAAFRILTFWFWIPIGWLAFTAMNRRIVRIRAAHQAADNPSL